MTIVKKMNKSYDKNVMLYFEGKIEGCSCISENNQELITKSIEKNEFVGKEGTKVEVSILENGNLLNLIILGLGKEEDFTEETLRKAIFKTLKKEKGSILITGDSEEAINLNVINEVEHYLNYDFNKYKSDEKKGKISIDVFTNKILEDGIEGNVLGEAVCIARDLVNEPANVIYPESLANICVDLGKECGFEVEVMEEKEIEKLQMKSYLEVARAAEKRPRLIVMRYKGDCLNPTKIYGLVGKGLTYDTGGLSLKPSTGMLGMKADMGGAATVIGAMSAIAKAKLKKNVTVVIAACENSIGGNAYRPGDVIGSMNGKTIEVTNTDAEGRLTLNDALTYSIRNEKVCEVIDVATLTGGVIVALGNDATGVFTNKSEMYEKLEKVSSEYGELVWRLPLFDKYKSLIKSDIADLKNSGGRFASAASAAKFLEEFVENTPWMHLDIAGTCTSQSEQEYFAKGATGMVVRALYGYYKEN